MIVGLLVALVVSFAGTAVALRVGRSIGFVDAPDGALKDHQGTPVPLGGVGVLTGLVAGLSAAGLFDPGLIAAGLAVFALGVADDRWDLSPRTRLLGFAFSGWLLVTLTPAIDGWLAGLAGIVLTLVTVNSVNLLDGLDTLASGVTLTAGLALAWFGVLLGVEGGWAPAVLSAAVLGFLFFNFPPAKAFLGDNGAYVIGVTLSWSVLLVGESWMTALVAAALIGVPLLDLGATVVRRLRSRTSLFSGDRDHLYDRIHRRGLTAGRVSVLYGLAQAIWALVIVGVRQQTGDPAAFLTAAIAGLLLVAAGSSAGTPDGRVR